MGTGEDRSKSAFSLRALSMSTGSASRKRAIRCLTTLAAVAAFGSSACGQFDSDTAQTGPGKDCHADGVQTAGNRVVWFFGDVQQGRNPWTTGGVDDPFGCAYSSLCNSLRRDVSESEFRESQGEAVSQALSADSYSGSRSDTGEYRLGVDVQHDGMDTLDGEISSSWSNADLSWSEHIDDRTIVEGSTRTETWRIDLVSEEGDWKVCDFVPPR